jgi:hypothetical protein
MFATKRQKITNEKECSSNDAESGFCSQIEYSSSNNSTSLDLPSPTTKRKCLAPRRASLQQISLNSTDATPQTSGYSSLLSSSSATIGSSTSLTSLAHRPTQRTPKKRKSEVSESDENFYNSYQFVSPLKIRKKENCAKLILKEKSSSENVILSSTPIRTNFNSSKSYTNKKNKWGKFRSFHPEKFHNEADKSTDKITNVAPNILPKTLAETSSLNISSFDFSNASFDLTNNEQITHQNEQHDIPANLINLWTDDIKQLNTQAIASYPDESENKSFITTTTVTASLSTKSGRRLFYNGHEKLDIIRRLTDSCYNALSLILGSLDEKSLLNFSHVSKGYQNIISSNKEINAKLQNYLKEHRVKTKNYQENITPPFARTSAGCNTIHRSLLSDNSRKRMAFGDSNTNSKRLCRTIISPQSPSSRRFAEMRAVNKS